MMEISVVKEFLPLIAAGGAVISATGLVPRVGPGRAAWIALRSRFGCKPNHESLRVDELKLLRSMIAEPLGQGFLVIAGEKGVGKTCFLRTVINKTPGVITIKALPSQNAHTIIKNVLRKLTGMPFDFFPPIGSVARVIFWHKIFTRGQSPVVIIDAAERKVGEEYAGLTAAVRTLVDDYKLRVIVDGSPNSFDESLLRTKRQRVFEIKPMTKEMVWQIGQLQPLFEYVKRTNLEDTVFAVLGGVPADYEELWENCAIHLKTGRDAREVIGSHLCTTIHAAIRLVKRACGSDALTTAKLRKLFQETNSFTMSTLVTNNLQLLAPDKVFREVEQNDEFVLTPASNAIGIVLRHNLTKRPTLDKLEQLIKKEE
jgi:hypothetical protein